MARITYTCPYCGAKFEADSSKESVKCPYCDSEVNLKGPAESSAIEGRSDTSSKKPVDKPWGSFDPAKDTWAKAQEQFKNNANKKGKKYLGLWILGWIFCFPIPLTILLLRSKRLEPKVKYSLVAALWIVVLVIGFIRNGKKNDVARDVSSEATVKQETSESETEVKEPEIITANMVDVTGKKLDEAIALLNEAGFMNVTTDVDKMGDWDPERIFVDEQSETPGTSVNVENEVFLSCKKICKLYIDVSSDANLFFDTYDMDIYLDGDTVGTVSNGQNITKLMEVVEGTHVIKAVNSGNDSKNASKSFDVDSDVTFSADIAHGGSIQFDNVSIVADISGSSLEVIDVKGMVLSDALSKLKEIGFTNVQYEPSGEIWDRSNWTIISQSVEPGTKTDKNTDIVLDCKKTTSYIDDQLIGLTANQAIGKAEELGFTYSFLNGATQTEITEEIDNKSEEEQALWVVKDASEATSSDKKLSLSVVYTGNVIVPDLVGSNLQAAIDELKRSQFSNVSSVTSDNIAISGSSNWLVIAQNIEPGSECPANESIVLTCKKMDDYIAEQFAGISAKDAIEKASEYGYSPVFTNGATTEDITGNILAIPENEQELWIVQKVSLTGLSSNRIYLTVVHTGNESTTSSATTSSITPTQMPTNSVSSVNYSTNTLDTVKDGDKGKYSYRMRGSNYDIYYIIDFDEGYVYRFLEGDGNNTCDRLKIDSGTLNEYVLITYHDDGEAWSYGLHFKYKDQPSRLIVEDNDGFEDEFSTTDLDEAQKLLRNKSIKDY